MKRYFVLFTVVFLFCVTMKVAPAQDKPAQMYTTALAGSYKIPELPINGDPVPLDWKKIGSTLEVLEKQQKEDHWTYGYTGVTVMNMLTGEISQGVGSKDLFIRWIGDRAEAISIEWGPAEPKSLEMKCAEEKALMREDIHHKAEVLADLKGAIGGVPAMGVSSYSKQYDTFTDNWYVRLEKPARDFKLTFIRNNGLPEPGEFAKVRNGIVFLP